MKTPKVSVIIPCYNQSEYIQECLDSVIAQTFKDFEVIIIDDGSTDNSWKIIQKYTARYPFISAIHQKNQGVILARNKAIQKAKGLYIFPLDADDKMTPQVLEKCSAILDKNSEIGIVGGQTVFFGIKTGKFELPAYNFPAILANNCLVCSCMFRRSDWEKVGGYNPNMIYGWEDYDFWLSLIEMGRQVYQFDDVFLYYRQLPKTRSTVLTEKYQQKTTQQLIRNHGNLYRKYPDYKNLLQGKGFMARKLKKLLLKSLCLVTPIKSWRHKLRATYRSIP